jgi:HEAT repeat protein
MPPGRLVAMLPARLTGLFLMAAALGCRGGAPYENKTALELEEMLRSEDPTVQVQGAYGLGRLGPEARTAVPALAAALHGKTVLLRENAARALGLIGPDARQAVPALTEALGDAEWTVRRQAALALGLIGPDARSAIRALERLADDPDHLVRQAAQDALPRIVK